jgi:hypothetical protein
MKKNFRFDLSTDGNTVKRSTASVSTDLSTGSAIKIGAIAHFLSIFAYYLLKLSTSGSETGRIGMFLSPPSTSIRTDKQLE